MKIAYFLYKKVEGLTLYLIEKDNEIKEQNQSIDDLEDQYKSITAAQTLKM